MYLMNYEEKEEQDKITAFKKFTVDKCSETWFLNGSAKIHVTGL